MENTLHPILAPWGGFHPACGRQYFEHEWYFSLYDSPGLDNGHKVCFGHSVFIWEVVTVVKPSLICSQHTRCRTVIISPQLTVFCHSLMPFRNTAWLVPFKSLISECSQAENSRDTKWRYLRIQKQFCAWTYSFSWMCLFGFVDRRFWQCCASKDSTRRCFLPEATVFW